MHVVLESSEIVLHINTVILNIRSLINRHCVSWMMNS